MNYYLLKGFVILEHKSKQLSSDPNDTKLIIHEINKQKTDHVMARYTAISSVANTINKLHLMYSFHYVYQ